MQNKAYSYDAVGNVLKIGDQKNLKSEVFAYDDIDRLIKAEKTINAGGVDYSLAYSYDAIGNMLSAIGINSSMTFSYGTTAPVHAPKSVDVTDASAGRDPRIGPEPGPQPQPEQGTPDLRVVGLRVLTANPKTGKAVDMRFIIKNTGTADANNAEWTLDTGGGLKSGTVSVAKSGEQIVSVSTIYRRAGTYTVVAKADPGNKIKELSESNNEKSTTVTVTGRTMASGQSQDVPVTSPATAEPAIEFGKPDLRIVSVKQLQNATVGSVVTFKFTVRNTGTAGVSGAEWSFDTGQEVKSGTVDVAAGKDVSIKLDTIYSSAGDYTARAIADPNKKVEELSEGNNEGILGVKVEGSSVSGGDVG